MKMEFMRELPHKHRPDTDIILRDLQYQVTHENDVVLYYHAKTDGAHSVTWLGDLHPATLAPDFFASSNNPLNRYVTDGDQPTLEVTSRQPNPHSEIEHPVLLLESGKKTTVSLDLASKGQASMSEWFKIDDIIATEYSNRNYQLWLMAASVSMFAGKRFPNAYITLPIDQRFDVNILDWVLKIHSNRYSLRDSLASVYNELIVNELAASLMDAKEHADEYLVSNEPA